jgi:uncharacterized repeat protein (TIGR03803 family)
MTKLSGGNIGLVVFVVYTAMASVSHAQVFMTLASFDGTDGATPYYGALAQGADGSLFGTTLFGGVETCGNSLGCGTAFMVTLAGQLSTVHIFCLDAGCPDGAEPIGGLLLAGDGNLYGTTSSYPEAGTVFKIDTRGRLTTIQTFNGGDGAGPYAGLVQGVDGSFYGTTSEGGTNDYGTAFRISPAGILTTLRDFSSSDGKFPYAKLALATNGDFYGTAINGGTHGLGTVFRLSSSGAFSVLYDFCSLPNCADGGAPTGGLLWANDGNFYGTTSSGGSRLCSCGTVFRMSPTGKVTVIHTFNNGDGNTPANNGDGNTPAAGVIQGTDGNLYGTTVGGGTNDYGTIFRIAHNGALTTLHNFDENGSVPSADLLQDTNGIFYGTTSHGGDGTIFSLDLGLGPFITFVRAFGKIGQTGGILGQGFTGTTSVSLNGTPVSFTVVSDTYIRGTVPVGATTGYVTVTTPSGTLSSNVPFQVIP